MACPSISEEGGDEAVAGSDTGARFGAPKVPRLR